MDRDQTLSAVAELARSGELSRDQLLAAFEQGEAAESGSRAVAHHQPRAVSMSDLFFYLGGAVVVLGIVILTYGSWSSLASPVRIAVTLGAALVAYVIGALLHEREAKYQGLAHAFALIAALLAPVGLMVTLNEAGMDLSAPGAQLLPPLILAALYGLTLATNRSSIPVIAEIGYLTWLYFAVGNYLLSNLAPSDSSLSYYLVLGAAAAYLFLGHWFTTQVRYRELSSWFSGIGALAFLWAALLLGGFPPNQNLFWELLYPFIVFGALALSISLKSRIYLIWGSFFLMAYIVKITAEYFSEGLGWPLALVIAGLLMMGVGYYTVQVNQKILQKRR